MCIINTSPYYDKIKSLFSSDFKNKDKILLKLGN